MNELIKILKIVTMFYTFNFGIFPIYNYNNDAANRQNLRWSYYNSFLIVFIFRNIYFLKVWHLNLFNLSLLEYTSSFIPMKRYICPSKINIHADDFAGRKNGLKILKLLEIFIGFSVKFKTSPFVKYSFFVLKI